LALGSTHQKQQIPIKGDMAHLNLGDIGYYIYIPNFMRENV